MFVFVLLLGLVFLVWSVAFILNKLFTVFFNSKSSSHALIKHPIILVFINKK